MKPLTEFVLVSAGIAGALAAVCCVLLRKYLESGMIAALIATSMLAAAVAAAWTGRWKRFLRAGNRTWQVVGLACSTVLIAMVLFPVVLLPSWTLFSGDREESLMLAQVAALFGLALGGLPALGLGAMAALRYVRRRAALPAAAVGAAG